MFTEILKILSGKEGKVSLHGWISNKRSSGGIQFIILRDGTGFIQCTMKKDKVGDKIFGDIEKLSVESVVEIEGTAKSDKRAPGGYEVTVDSMKILSEAEGDYPITKKSHGLKFLLDNRHLSLRSQKMNAIMKIREKVLDFARQWLKENGYRELQPPILTSLTQEGGAKLFEVRYFGKKARLSQSWQLYGEAIMYGFGKAFTIWPTFSAEESRTRKHLSEFWQLEVEIPFCDFSNAMKVEQLLLHHILESVVKNCERELREVGRDPEDLRKMITGFESITYDEALNILKKNGMKLEWGCALGADEEDKLTRHFNKLFFVTHLPKEAVAFYHKEYSANPKLTLSGDLFAPEGYGNLSFCGAGLGERIENEKELLERMKKMKMKTKDYQWYIDLRKWGSVQHSGFALGIERLVMWICKLKNIRNATLFPRTMNRIYP